METYQHNGDGRASGKINLLLLTAHQGGHLLLYDLDQLLSGGEAIHHFLTDRPSLDLLNKILNDLEIDIGFQEGNPHFLQGLLDILLRQLSMASQFLKNGI